MRVASSLLASLFAVLTFSSFAAQAPSSSPPSSNISPDTWITVVRGENMRYDVLAGSMEVDPQTFSVQFMMRVLLKAPMMRNGKEIRYFAERSLVLCRENLFITTNQLFYNSKNEHVDTNIISEVYENPNNDGQPVTTLMRFACGFSPADKTDTPENRSRKYNEI